MEKTENLQFYENMIKKHCTSINDIDEIKNYVDFCLNHVKENIVYCYNNNHKTHDVIVELFKRGMAKKWLLDNTI